MHKTQWAWEDGGLQGLVCNQYFASEIPRLPNRSAHDHHRDNKQVENDMSIPELLLPIFLPIVAIVRSTESC